MAITQSLPERRVEDPTALAAQYFDPAKRDNVGFVKHSASCIAWWSAKIDSPPVSPFAGDSITGTVFARTRLIDVIDALMRNAISS
ncbi:hypothetical protein [Methylococcus sp. EFPC2]|uniref:hypothetical protein n=1 Tax=Methylococcus sp. EFPC2 TaxID=2812648 RepID=UPI001967302D|nr:hypothetical protein [Methylococcus sp. EFPC2]QSA96945.1 hypothetical protein JWZ97_17350 [Methylococcus sp. EFPC2]